MSPAQFINLRDGAKDSKTGKPRGMRKETARRIEEAAGKPAGWLDIEHLGTLAGVLGTHATQQVSPREGIESGLAFLGFLLQEGSAHGLYDATMRQLDRMTFKAVAELDDDEQAVLLLPMVDVEDLATDWDASEWAKVLRTRLVPEWEDEMRSIVLHRVELEK